MNHRDHLELAWTHLRRGEGDRVLPYLRHVAEAHGGAEKLNVTMTRFWVDLTAHAIDASRAASLDELLVAVPQLLDKELPLRHWSREALCSPQARTVWMEPDLQPLPF
jgi:hypothetical protein